MNVFGSLGISLAIGLLIGLERGWRYRESPEGARVAGLRTFAILGLCGGVVALLAARYGAVVLGLGFVAVAVVLAIAYQTSSRVTGDYGITSELAALTAFGLGAASPAGYPEAAAAAAVVVALVLGLKPELHSWLQRLDRRELVAGLQLALISVVILPLLPDRGFGPWQALNPYELWWLVVLIAGISFIGHFAIRIAGERRGILLTGFFGGLASSTALTLAYARMGVSRPGLQRLLAVGTVIATATVFPRMIVEVAVVNPALVAPVSLALGTMAVVAYALAVAAWIAVRRRKVDAEAAAEEPFQLRVALQFAVFLAIISVLGEGARRYFGEAGIYVLSLASGLSDVDAITLSLARMAREALEPSVAVNGMLIAAMTNTLVKAGLVAVICRGVMAVWVGGIAVVTVAAGVLVLAFF
ncbi:MAG: MgtC/SapB family protein [Ectothiorhodospiraceae bacterium]|jgi:uncharacterized membrane protein (DUF4010 family)